MRKIKFLSKSKSFLKTTTIIILLFLSVSSLSYATKYYVSTSGNNANDGLTTATPWQTIQYAETRATSAGDIIALKRGDIWATALALGIHHGGTVGNPIIWDGALWGSGANAIIRSSSNRTGSNMSVVNIIGCSYVTFQNITVDGNNTYTFGLVIGGGSDGMYSGGGVQNAEKGIIVQNSAVLNCGNGANYTIGFLCQTWHNDMSDITIEGNTFDGADDELLCFYGGKTPDGGTPAECKNVYIKYNTLTNWGRRGASTGSGLLLNNKITNVTVEHNTLTTGPKGKGHAFPIGHNEPVSGYFPTNITIRYNKITVTESNSFCLYIAQGQAIKANCYSNILIQGINTTDTNGGGVWVVKSDSPAWAGAAINFYNNTIYTKAGRSFQNDCAVAGVVTLKNNLIYNTGTSDYGNYCIINNTAGATTHSNNSLYRSASANYTKVLDGGTYIQSNAQVAAWEAAVKVTDPLLVTPGTDFHLKAGSPAIASGIPIPIAGITKDIEGGSFNNPPDIGCYQSLAISDPLPVYVSSSVKAVTPAVIEMTYNLSLANVVPPPSAFNVQVNSTTRALNSVAIVGGDVQLTLASAAVSSDIVTVSYTKPAINPLQTPSGGEAASNSNQLVTNNLITSLTQIKSEKINMTIYPNPVHHVLNISLENTSTFSIGDATISPQTFKILDMSGKLVFEKKIDSGVSNVQIPINLKSGVFIALLVSHGLTLSSQKLIVYN